MAFEGQPVSIPLKGIIRAGADNLVDAGSLNEAINLEYKDGSFVPYAPAVEEVSMDYDTQMVRIHKVYGTENMVAILGGYLYWRPADALDDRQWHPIDEKDTIEEFVFVGNVICTNHLKYYIWNNTDQTYNAYANGLFSNASNLQGETLPTVSFMVSNKTGEKDTSRSTRGEILYKNTVTYRIDNNSSDAKKRADSLQTTDIKEAVAACAMAAQDCVQKNGRLYGAALVCYAYRLVTGEYIAASNPVLVNFPSRKNLYNSDAKARMLVPTNCLSGNRDALAFWKGFTTDSEAWDDTDVRYSDADVIEWSQTNGVVATYDAFSKNVPLYGFYSNGSKAGDNNYLVVGAASNKLRIKINDNINEDYKDIIDSLCIFMSPQINPYKSLNGDNVLCSEVQYTIQGTVPGRYEPSGTLPTIGYQFKTKDIYDIRKEVSDISTMYLVEEFKFSDIKKDTVWKSIDLKGKLGDTLYTLPSLPVTAFNRVENVSGHVEAFNARLHLFGYTQKLFDGYTINDYLSWPFGYGQMYEGQGLPSGTTYDVAIVAEIKNREYKSVVVNGPFQVSSRPLLISPTLSYPDVNATKLTILYKKVGEASYEGYEFPLLPNSHLGIASFVSYESKDENLLNDIGIVGAKYISGASLPSPMNTTRERKNGLKVSDSANPIYFPAASTLDVGDKEIIGMAPLAVALSQDAFGKNPMIALCSDGIYALEVDQTGTAAYTACHPFPSREVCLQRSSICQLDGAIVFVSNKGMVLLTESGAQLFLPNLNGVPRNIPSSHQPGGMNMYHNLVTNQKVADLYSSISKDDFLDYAKHRNTHISYVSEKNKLLVYNMWKNYSYFIDIPTRTVTKLGLTIDYGDGNYPSEKYFHNTNFQTADMYTFNYLSANGPIDILLQTRPIHIANGLKNGLRVVLNGRYKSSVTAEKWLDMIVLGSLDSENWQLVGIKERRLDDIPNHDAIHEFGTVIHRLGIKYLMVIVAGSLDPDSHIEDLQLSYKVKYNNKLKQ